VGKNIEVSFVRHPLVVVRFVGLPNDDEFRVYLDEMARNLHDSIAKKTSTAVVIDTTVQVNPVSAAQRRLQADWIKNHQQALRLGCAGTAFVISSALHRGVMTAVLWLQQLPYPYSVFGALGEAEAWCLGRLSLANAPGAWGQRTT
jgi:hypothetical protein